MVGLASNRFCCYGNTAEHPCGGVPKKDAKDKGAEKARRAKLDTPA
jgi:hypothetical protein